MYIRFSAPSIQIKTTIAPLALLAILKDVERTVGRLPSIRNGPRAVDLDILFYDNALIDTRPESLKGGSEGLEGHLVIPHPRILEREFVLRPLYESALPSLLSMQVSVDHSSSIQHDSGLCSPFAPQTNPRAAL